MANYSASVPSGITNIYLGKFGVPSWRQTMTAKTWKEIGNTMFNVDPGRDAAKNPDYPAAAPWAGVWSSSQQVDNDDVLAFSGAAYDSGLDRLLVYGGGHSDYGGNEVYQFDVQTALFTLIKDPAGSIAYPEESGVFVDSDNGEGGTVNAEKILRQSTTVSSGIYWDEDDGEPMPRSIHSYGSLVIDPTAGDFYVVDQPNQFVDTATSSSDGFKLDHLTKTWSRIALNPMGGATNYEAGSTAWITSLGKIAWWGSANSNLKTYDPDTDVWTTHSANLNVTGYKGMTYDADRDALIIIHSTGLWAVEASDLDTLITPDTFSGSAPTIANIHGWNYYAPLDAIFNWPGSGTTLNVLQPPAVGQSLATGTWTWSTMTADAGNTVTPPAAYGSGWTYGRQFVSTVAKALMVVVDAGDQIQAFALPETL